MKLTTYRRRSEARLGLVCGEWIVDVQDALRALGKRVGAASVPRLAAADLRSLLAAGPKAIANVKKLERFVAVLQREGKPRPACAVPVSKARLLAPVLNPPKIICVGQNYRDHCLEQGVEPPDHPIIFAKFATCLIGHGDAIVKPRVTQQLDYEAELAFVIGRKGRRIPEEKALAHVAGYMNFHDVSARDIQFGDKQWVRGKSFDTSAPCGPWLVTRDEVPNPQNLKIQLWLNGVLMQDSSTANFLFSVAHMVSFISQTITLEVGDIITTGTPPGVGVFRKPPVFMKGGDRVAMEVEGLGRLENRVVEE